MHMAPVTFCRSPIDHRHDVRLNAVGRYLVGVLNQWHADDDRCVISGNTADFRRRNLNKGK